MNPEVHEPLDVECGWPDVSSVRITAGASLAVEAPIGYGHGNKET